MIARLKLWQKIVIITAILGLPLIFVTREYVRLVKELSLNNLRDQLAAIPAIEHIGELTRLVQDYGANLPLWVIGSDIAPDKTRETAERINALVDLVTADLKRLKGYDSSQWGLLAAKIKDSISDADTRPRGFSVYADLSGSLTNFAEILSYSSKFYSGAGNLIVPSRLAVDLTPSLAENVNLLRGYITFKIFINEKTLKDLSTTSSYLSLAENRYREIVQSLSDLRTHSPALYLQIQPSVIKVDNELVTVRGMVEQYLSDSSNNKALEPGAFFKESSELIEAIYDLHSLSLRLIDDRLKVEIEAADAKLNSIIGIASVAGVLVLLLIFLISRGFVRGVRHIAIVSEQVAAGNRSIRFPALKGNDEIQFIMSEIGRIYVAICASEERARIDNWLLERQKLLNESIRGETDLKRFAEDCLKSINEAIGAECSNFYRVDQRGFNLVHSCGLLEGEPKGERHRILTEVVRCGGGLHYSQASLPLEYQEILSETDQRRAQALVLFPIRFQYEVVAVMEFLSFDPIDPVSLKFLEAVEENIAVLLKALFANVMVIDLLSTTQQQSEELRGANIDLESKTQLLNDQQQTLQNVNQELEEQRSELEAQNEKLEVVIDNLAVAKKEAEEKGREAEVANRYKSIFLANMSHELRTPLNSIMILAQVLAENREKSMTENQIKNARIIHTSGKDLLKLINEILDLSRIEAGKIDINAVTIDVKNLAEETKDMYDALAQNKSLNYSVEVTEDSPPSVESDPVRLAQIIRNFVANAIKFTEQGSVNVFFRKSSNPEYTLQIDVKDTGVGIDDEAHVVIFEPFRQLNNALSRKQEGTGLGLAISKNLALKLGGDITLSSAPGEGSTFSLLLPSKMPDAVDGKVQKLLSNESFIEDDRDTVKLSEPMLVIIEDDQTFAQLLVNKCRAEGFKCVVSPRGRDCVPFAERFRPHGIILDIKLPDADGLDILSDLKSNSKTRNIPVHVFSGADQGREEEAMRRGAAEFIAKPISIEKLDQVLKALPHEELLEDISLFLHSVDSRMAMGKSAQASMMLSENIFEGKNILIVDDDIRNVYSLRQILHGRGCNILVAENGREALEVLDLNPETDLILMDIMMPEMDGYEAMRRIRLNKYFKKLPVIALTAKAMKDDRDLCLAAGASDYLLKPIDTEKLLMLMRVWLGK